MILSTLSFSKAVNPNDSVCMYVYTHIHTCTYGLRRNMLGRLLKIEADRLTQRPYQHL